jgi:hypothetical protein
MAEAEGLQAQNAVTLIKALKMENSFDINNLI